MDWNLYASTFAVVFLAELGDKTQIATLSLAASGRSRWSVFLGAATALLATTVLAVLLGEAVSRWIPAHWVRRAAGLAFVVMGAWFLVGSRAS